MDGEGASVSLDLDRFQLDGRKCFLLAEPSRALEQGGEAHPDWLQMVFQEGTSRATG